jgi:hypothetical protein
MISTPSGPPAHSEHYFSRSARAMHSLVFLVPFLLLYEIGMAVQNSGHIKARSVLINFLSEFGSAGRYLAPVVIVVILVTLHIVKREIWRFDWRLYIAMAAEAVAEAIPLLMFALVWGRQIANQLQGHAAAALAATPTMLANGGQMESWFVGIVTALGAGIYEELVFRLIAIALLHGVFVDIIGLKRGVGAVLSVVSAAVLFSAYHFTTAAHPFEWTKFLFFALAGCYLGVIYIMRGFGIVAAVHAFYNIFCVIIAHTTDG